MPAAIKVIISAVEHTIVIIFLFLGIIVTGFSKIVVIIIAL